ncbi:MAG: mechanosensitive ion channel domain-containing protein [Rhizomicrobium sp.]|jgi:small conductance mechanosensitive channel
MTSDKLIHASAAAQPTLEALLISGAMDVISAVVILILGWTLASWAARGTRMGLSRLHRFDETLKPLVASLVRYAILIATIIAVLQRFGVETTSLIAVLGAAGLAVGLALQGTLSNVAAGVMLLLLRPFRVGDWITAASQSGSVREVGLFTTILIGPDQTYISIPNAAVFGGVILNASREPTTRINFTVSIDIANDIEAAEKIVMDVLSGDSRILKMPPPATGTVALKEYAADLLVRGWVMNANAEQTQFDLQRTIKERFNKAAITVPARRQTSIAREDAPPAAKSPVRKAG